MAALEPFVGVWDTTGTIFGPNGKHEGSLIATDAYEWFSGGHFLLHHVDARMGDAEIKALEVIGAGPHEGVCLARSFDSAGQSNEYEVALTGRRWVIDGKTERFRGKFSEDLRTLEGKWELSDDGIWRPWMMIKLVRR